MKTDTQKLEKKKKIIDTAYQLFHSSGVGSTAIDDVVKSAGIARGTFYLYFKDKSDLLEQLIFFKSSEYAKQMVSAAVDKIRDENLSFIQSLSVFIDMYIDFMQEHKDVLAIISKNTSSCLRNTPNFADEDSKKMFDIVLGFLCSNGFDEEKAKKTMYIVADMVGSLCSDAILFSKPFTLSEIREDIKQSAISIILSAKSTNEEKSDENDEK